MQRSTRSPWPRPLLSAILAAATCAGIDARAQAPSVSREELMRQWDLDRDGKVDEAEAEIARSRMRRSRIESQQRGRTDPLTGRPRDDGGSARDRAGRADDELLLVPGDGSSGRGGAGPDDKRGEQPRRMADPAAEDDEDQAERDRRRALSRPVLPGTRAPELSSPLPSVRPPSTTPAAPSASVRRPAGTPPAARPPAQPWEQLRGQPRPAPTQDSTSRPAASGPGIISGGIRAGVSPARPGYGAPAMGGDLNAGRLPAGVPQQRGLTSGSQRPAAGGASPAPPTVGGRSPVTSTIIGGSRPLPPRGQGGPGPGVAAPGSQVPATGPRLPTARPTTPRPPTPSPDDFFNR